MKLDKDQEALIAQIAAAAARRREARANAKERARKLVEAELLAFDIEVQKFCALGEAAGVPYRQIAQRGLGVENGTTARKEAEAGRAFIEQSDDEPVQSDEAVQRFTVNEDRTLTVTFEPADFEGKIKGITERQTVTFAFDPDDGRPLPVDGDYNTPAARLALTPEGRAEIAAYMSNN